MGFFDIIYFRTLNLKGDCMKNDVVATVRLLGGIQVLDDPVALAVISAVEKRNCHATLSVNKDRVAHFLERIYQRNDNTKDVVIVVINVDDKHGGQIAEALMPGHDWQQIRDAGQVPFARGIAKRDFIQEALSFFDDEASTKLKELDDGVAVVVVDHGVAEIFKAEQE